MYHLTSSSDDSLNPYALIFLDLVRLAAQIIAELIGTTNLPLPPRRPKPHVLHTLQTTNSLHSYSTSPFCRRHRREVPGHDVNIRFDCDIAPTAPSARSMSTAMIWKRCILGSGLPGRFTRQVNKIKRDMAYLMKEKKTKIWYSFADKLICIAMQILVSVWLLFQFSEHFKWIDRIVLICIGIKILKYNILKIWSPNFPKNIFGAYYRHNEK